MHSSREPGDVATLPSPDRQLRHIQATELHDWWPKVSLGLQRVHDGSGDNWIPEDVYAAISTGAAQLYASPEGFAVFQTVPQFDGKALLIWCAYGWTSDLMDYRAQAITLAKANACRRILFHSKRPGWARRAKQLGFREIQRTYALEV